MRGRNQDGQRKAMHAKSHKSNWKLVETNTPWTKNTTTVARWKSSVTGKDVEIRRFNDKRSHPYMSVLPHDTLVEDSERSANVRVRKYMDAHK